MNPDELKAELKRRQLRARLAAAAVPSEAAMRGRAAKEFAERHRNAGTQPLDPKTAGRVAYRSAMDEYALTHDPDPGALGAAAANLAPGLTFGAADEIAAGIGSLFEDRPYKEILEGLRRRDDVIQEKRPYSSAVGQIAGMLAPSMAAYKGAEAGLRAVAPMVNPASLWTRVGLGGATGAAEGAVLGAGEADGGDMMASVGRNAVVGLLGGMAAPAAFDAVKLGLKAVANPIASALNLPSSKRAGAALQTYMKRASMTPDDVTNALREAGAEGQDAFRVADVLGMSGQRALAGITRQPGDETRQAVGEFLMQRQAGQSNRLTGFLADALDAPDTAAARTASMKAARKTAADTAYSAAREGAGPVDVRDVLGVIDDRIGPMIGSGVADDGISGQMAKWRGRLASKNPAKSSIMVETGEYITDPTRSAVELSDFDRVLALKQDVQDVIGRAIRAGENNAAREYKKVEAALDAALEMASDGYRAANDGFAKASKAIAAIDEGTAATSGRVRAPDVAKTYGAMSPDAKAGFRAGYADPLIARAENAAVGVNKARPLTSEKSAAELAILAKDPAKLARQITRENTMFETNVAALGGSRTADNLADIKDNMGMTASVIGNLVSGRWGTAGRQIADKAMAGATGTNPATRELIAKALLSRDPQAALAPVIRAAARLEGPRKVIEALLRSGAFQAQ